MPPWGGDVSVLGDEAEALVSIHAPVKGATQVVFDHRLLELVSIHAPVKGATATYCSNELKSLLPPQDCETSISILNKYSNLGA